MVFQTRSLSFKTYFHLRSFGKHDLRRVLSETVNAVKETANSSRLCMEILQLTIRARGSVVGCGTTLQIGRSTVRFPMRPLDFSIYLILPAALWSLGSTQPLKEMSTRNLPGG
jgi:hypothetical protein